MIYGVKTHREPENIMKSNRNAPEATARTVRFARIALSLILAAALAALASAPAGCDAPAPRARYADEWLTVSPESRQGDVSVYQDVQFADIPVPEEYMLLPAESSSFQGSLFRNARLTYQGRLEWSLALDFYRTQLAAAGWQLAKMDRGFNFRVLYFDKGQEKLIVVVRQIKNGSRAEIQLDNTDKNDLLLKGKLINPGY